MMVMGLFAELGVILCFVGIFFTAMLAKIPAYYRSKYWVVFQKKTAYLPLIERTLMY